MHPEGSTCPPPLPPSHAAAAHLHQLFRRLLDQYNSMVKDLDLRQQSVRTIFEPYPYINRREIDRLVERAETLVRVVGSNPFIDASANRSPAEEYGMLQRLWEKTRDELDAVGEEVRKIRRTVLENPGLARPAQPADRFAPTQEVLQLREENTMLRDENTKLGEELDEAREQIRRLEEKLERRG